MGGGTYSFKSIPKDRFFDKLFTTILYLLSEFLSEIYWKEVAQEIFFFKLSFEVWPGIWTMALRLITQHTNY